MRDEHRLPPAVWHPGAAEGCGTCRSSGWVLEGLRWGPCACVGACPRCGGAGFLARGLETCQCRVAVERVGLLNATGLGWGGGSLPAEAAAWFAAFRPEDGWPWLAVLGPFEAGVAHALARLVAEIGVPVETVDPAVPRIDEGSRGRVVACLGVEALGHERAERLVERCAADGRTLVVATSRPSAAPGGLEASIGTRAFLSLWAQGVVVE